MFETKMYKRDQLTNYIGARVTDEEAVWLKSETQRRKLSMSDLLRLALAKLHAPKKKGSKAP